MLNITSYEIFEKGKFGQTELTFLGFKVTAEELKPPSIKVDAIKKFPEPKSFSNLRRILGTVNFYHRFIPNCVKLQQPLTALLRGIKKNSRKQIIWTEEAKRAFQALRDALCQATNFTHPSKNAEISLTTDASHTAIGAVLHQIVKNEKQP
ncbi:transposon Tf2-9 polyprotein [Nephila pilipes]|uniref:Transposon Tf2-9 polyprotein n=1 Tax=Nephila pilipes TaxID=299642 RepID=A0A8X6TJW1_NEPPI|nr:transposon Tf2-9 polyprotein [Nephila pilipes]